MASWIEIDGVQLTHPQAMGLLTIGTEWTWWSKRGNNAGLSLYWDKLVERRVERRSDKPYNGLQYRLTPRGAAIKAQLESLLTPTQVAPAT